MGTVAGGGVRVLNGNVVRTLGVPAEAVEAVGRSEHSARSTGASACTATAVHGLKCTAARRSWSMTGLPQASTMLAAVRALRAHEPLRVVVAVPTAAGESCGDLRSRADEVICAATSEPFRAVGSWYEDISQTSDKEVRELLAFSRHAPAHETGGESQ
jgi:predicted phosphoribosyltransferase